MAYFVPYADESGLHIPSYNDIKDSLIEDVKSIYGQEIYLDIDSQDYQLISTISYKINAALQTIQIAYNSRSPATATGTALDSVVKINGIKRKSAASSTCSVVISGTPSTIITNGVVSDISNNKWDLPASVTIEAGGSVIVNATCQITGPIVALPGDINKIVTPTYGWTSVTNTESAIVGRYVETDSQIRARQALSTAIPSKTVIDGLYGAIAEISGVTRYRLYENDSDVADSNGLPAHSLTTVVEGGTDAEVANAIYLKKTPGVYTNGTSVVTIPVSYGEDIPIRFYRPTYIDIDVFINLKTLSGYTTQTTDDIKAAIVNYLNGLQIGDDLSASSLWGIALSVMPDLRTPLFSVTSVTIAKHLEEPTTNDIIILFNEVTRGSLENITINIS